MKKSIFFLIIAVLFVAGCSNNSQVNGSSVIEKDNNLSVEKIEIYHFHATNQCYSCKTVGAYAEETVNTYFADELKSSKIVFAHINGDLPENKDLVMKYKVTGSSLWIGTYTKDGQFSAEENTNVWYKISNKEDYMAYLKGIIEQKLGR
jgi:protein involved in sex pheromone biosynthesis